MRILSVILGVGRKIQQLNIKFFSRTLLGGLLNDRTFKLKSHIQQTTKLPGSKAD